MISKLILGDKSPTQKNIYFWSVLSSTVYSLVSFLLLIIVTNIFGVTEAGIFSISYTISQQLMVVGIFSVRQYQASDVSEANSFDDYFNLRIVTVAIQLISAFFWAFFSGFDGYKTTILVILTIYKSMECLSDVFEGLYQQKGRFDVAGKSVFIKSLFSIIVFTITAFLTRDLLASVISMAVLGVLGMLFYDLPIYAKFSALTFRWNFRNIWGIVLGCLPLFLCAYLFAYINNCAKYAISAFMTDEMQTYFSILFMPAFVINMFSGFVLKPQITELSLKYSQNDHKGFFKSIVVQIVYVVAITILCIFGAYLLGIPVLSIIYGVDLSPYKLHLVLLIFGGGLSAVYVVFNYALTIMRKQYTMLIGVVVTSVVAFFLMPKMVQSLGLLGACYGYIVLMAIISLIMFAVLVCFIKKWISIHSTSRSE